jgi:hypothetical protein
LPPHPALLAEGAILKFPVVFMKNRKIGLFLKNEDKLHPTKDYLKLLPFTFVCQFINFFEIIKISFLN